MASNYTGIAQFLASLSLMTDGDSPSAALFRLPNERLLDNDVFLKAQQDATRSLLNLLLTNALLNLRNLRGDGQLYVPTDTNNTAGVVSLSQATSQSTQGLILIAKGDRSVQITDGESVVSGTNAMLGPTTRVQDAARNGSRVVVVGAGGNRCAFTIDGGNTWTAGGAMGGSNVFDSIVYNPVHSRFIASEQTGGTATINHSTDGTSWTAVTTSLANAALSGIACLANGDTFVCGNDTGLPVAFSKSTNGGTSWADTGGTVASPGGYGEPGWLDGGGPSATQLLWHVGRVSSATVISSSPDGVNWTVRRSETWNNAGTPTRPVIRVCKDTGIIFVAQLLGSSQFGLLASIDNGATWLGPRYYGRYAAGSAIAFSAAGGRLVLVHDAQYLASQGLGFGWVVP